MKLRSFESDKLWIADQWARLCEQSAEVRAPLHRCDCTHSLSFFLGAELSCNHCNCRHATTSSRSGS